MRALPAVALVVASLAMGCAAPPPRPPLVLEPFTALRPEDFPGAPSVLSGFATEDGSTPMRIGDAALLGLEVHRDGWIERQLLLLEVADLHWRPAQGVVINGVARPDGGGVKVRPSHTFTITWTTRPAADADAEPEVEQRSHAVNPVDVRLTRLDAAGRSLGTSVATLYEQPLATGWWPYTQPVRDVVAHDHAFALTMSMQELAARDAVLQDLLFRVVDTPSLWSIATHLGVGVVVKWKATNPPPAPVAVDGFAGEVRTWPFELQVNGDTASWVTMLVSQPHSGTRVCGGLVGAIAQHPTDPRRLAVVRLLAMRRGPAP